MALLERAIYSITYYWHGIDKRAILGVMWLYDKLHQTEFIDWSEVNGLPYNQSVVDKIEEMIVSGDLRVTDRWTKKYSKVGLEPVQINNSIKIFKPSEKFSENFRITVKYLLHHPKTFKQFYNQYKDKFILPQKVYNWVHDKLIVERFP